MTINFHFTDLDEDHVLGVGESAIHHRPGAVAADAVATVSIDRSTFVDAIDDVSVLEGVDIEGDRAVVHELLAGLVVGGTPALIEP